MNETTQETWLNQHVLTPIMKVVNTKPMNALKNGMVYALPFIIIGSIFLILSNIPYPPLAKVLADSGWAAFFSQANNVSFGILAVWASIGIAYCYVRDEGYEALPAGLTSFSVFLLLQHLAVKNPLIAATAKGGALYSYTNEIDKLPHVVQTFLKSDVGGVINTSWLGGQGMIGAILIGILVGWSYSKMLKAGWAIKLPDQVPSNVAGQFTAMIPAGIIITVGMLVYAFFDKVLSTDLLSEIYRLIQMPLQNISDSLPGALIIAFLVPFFWFFGVHGGLIMGAITSGLLIPNTFDNAALYKAGKLTLDHGAHIVTNEFYNNFINLTGSGITIGLVVFTLWRARSVQLRSIGKIEAVPALFNINEPFLFGLPLVLNPMLAIPFFLTPVIVALTTYLVIWSGIVPPLNGVAAPWTTPPIISGFLIGGWKMAVWQTITLVMSTAVYFPFAAHYDKILFAQEQAALEQENEVK
ncbi:PTS sugar transporter subunit IIC [Weissella diestrammenae]|uniref:Permease IIC component n=1 Tax=Weissella diestrammenae TaxID=1162633 RepID=A0A7G9T4K1_9LACO|nr:PTS sugar transporter subunit IIC [Weissella diestrammenae]MCM0582052.1 PTS sugar transporter subunit IIC [Weissella diestrammenae]QNN75026.1 PTS sugar transporter subunit IIC [Weissella diestrammenae]